MAESFLYHFTRSKICIMTSWSAKCRVFLLMSIVYATLQPRTHLLCMKPVSGPGRASQCSVLKTIFEKMALRNVSSLTPGLHNLQASVKLLPLKIQSIHLWLQLLLRESLMKRTMPLHLWWLHCITTLYHACLHRPTPTSTMLLQHLPRLGRSRYSMSLNLFGPYWQKGEKHMSW